MKKTRQESMNDDDQRLHQSATANLTRTIALEYADVASVSMPLDREQRSRLSIVPGTSPPVYKNSPDLTKIQAKMN